MKRLQEITSQKDVDELRKEIQGFKGEKKCAPDIFVEIARAILSGYFQVTSTRSGDENGKVEEVRIYPTCVEIYCHDEKGGICDEYMKDYIVYHRNTKSTQKDVLKTGVLHNHVSGIDITFEKGESPAEAIRLSALIRQYRIEIKAKGKNEFERYYKKNAKSDIVVYPTHLYDDLYSFFDIFEGFSIKWVDGEQLCQADKLVRKPRINVFKYNTDGGKVSKKLKPGANKQGKGEYVPDEREWQFSILEEE